MPAKAGPQPAPDAPAALPTGSDHLYLVVVGHVDHGKSTLIGRLLFDTHSVPEGKAERIEAACRAEGMEFEYAFLMDALLEEQAQNITMDTTRVPFRTARRPIRSTCRSPTVITPGSCIRLLRVSARSRSTSSRNENGLVR